MTLSRETILRVAQKQDQVRAQQQAQVSAFQIQLQHEAHIAELARVADRRNALLASATTLFLSDRSDIDAEVLAKISVRSAMKLMDEVDRQCDARGAEDAKTAEAGTAPVDGGTLKP